MRDFNFKLVGLGLMILTASVAWGQRPYYLLPGVHPGYTLVNMKPAGMTAGTPNVGAMAWLPDGRLFVASMSINPAGGNDANRLGPSNGYIFSGLATATSNSTVTVVQAGSNYQMPTGAVTVGDTIYVVDNDSGLTRLTPGTGGTYTKKVIYSGLLGYLTGKSGSGYRTWVGGLAYKAGYLYAAVGMGLIPGGTSEFTDANIYRGKGTILKIKQDGSTVDTVAGGVRNPVDLEWGPDGEMFYADNQGSFMPASAIFQVTQGAFFGHLKTPFDDQKRTAPAIIFPYGSDLTGGTATNPCVSRVATGFVQMKPGTRYPGQLLIGSDPQNGINRVFMEKVGGVYQGAVFPFSQGFGVGPGVSGTGLPGVLPEFRANVHSLTYGPDGQLYVGGGNSPGGASSGSHGIDGIPTGALARMTSHDSIPVFEMKAVRSLSATQMEVEFTEPVVSAATSNFAVGQGISVQSITTGYGAGFQGPTSALAVTAVTLNTEKTKATLTITGLQQRPTVTTAGSTEDRTWGSLVQIHVTGVAAVSGRTMWGDGTGGGVAWYTLNKFGPGVDAGFATAIQIARSLFHGVPGLSFSRSATGIELHAPVAGAYTVRVSDLRGVTLANYSANGDLLVPASMLGGGVTLLEAKAADGQHWISAVPKL